MYLDQVSILMGEDYTRIGRKYFVRTLETFETPWPYAWCCCVISTASSKVFGSSKIQRPREEVQRGFEV